MAIKRWQFQMPSLLMLLSIGLMAGCSTPQSTDHPTQAPRIPHAPDSVTLYAIDGPAMVGAGFDLGNGRGPYDPLANYTSDQLFHDFPILGEVDLTGTVEGDELARVIEGHRQSPQGLIPGCVFKPRHGLRVIRGGVVADYVLCFECEYFRWTLGNRGQQHGTQTLHPAYYAAFTTPLTEAGIELAP